MRLFARKGYVLASLIVLTACQMKPAEPKLSTSMRTSTKPELAVAKIAKIAQKCWFKSGDKAFKQYRLANEVSSFVGQPRFLLVPQKNPGGLPLLVVQAVQKGKTASGKFTNINAFGPLLQSAHGKRILGDVNRWNKGDTKCS